MKELILVEMLLLWFGTINHYLPKFNGNVAETVTQVGLRTAVPTAILSFWLFLIADLGAGKIAALLGGTIAFAYLVGSVDALNNITDRLLKEVAPETTTTAGATEPGTEPAAPSPEMLGDLNLTPQV